MLNFGCTESVIFRTELVLIWIISSDGKSYTVQMMLASAATPHVCLLTCLVRNVKSFRSMLLFECRYFHSTALRVNAILLANMSGESCHIMEVYKILVNLFFDFSISD